MKSESIEFLRELQDKMNTQDNVGQAHPRFWVIMDYKWVMTAQGRGEDRLYCFDLCEQDSLSETEIGELIVDYILDRGLEDAVNEDDVFYENWDLSDIKKETDFDVIVDILDSLDLEHEILQENFEGFIVPNTMFLTLSEAKRHLEANNYHYHKNAHAYAMTAWRSPEVEKLMSILMTEEF